MSQDSWPIDFNNPVELNRYIYTANNPVNYTDATGYAEGVLSYGLRLLDAVKLRYVILAGLAITVVALAIADIDTIINLAKQTKRSGKEKKDDIPSWAKNNDLLKQKKGEKPSAAAKRALDKNYGEGGWSDVGAGSEFSKLKKWFEENPGGTGEPPDDSKDNSNPKGKNR